MSSYVLLEEMKEKMKRRVSYEVDTILVTIDIMGWSYIYACD